MKNTSALSLVFISIMIIIIITTFGDASTYVSFSEAKSLYSSGNFSKIHVVGKLNKNSNDKIVGIKKGDDMLSFTFEMVTKKGKKKTSFTGNQCLQTFYYLSRLL